MCVCAAQRIACAELVRIEGALAVLAHSQAALGCSTVFFRMAGMIWVEVFGRKMDGSSFVEPLPWELSNTDYFRRVVAQVGYSLQPLVEDIVKDKGMVQYTEHKDQKVFVWCPKNDKFEVAVEKTWNKKKKKIEVDTNAALAQQVADAKVVFQSQDPNGDIGCDAFYLMKHIKHDKHIETYANLLGCTDKDKLEKLETALNNLIICRNQLAHMSLTSDTNWLNKTRMKSIFAHATFVVTYAGEYLKTKKQLKNNLALQNMKSLNDRWIKHTENKDKRQLHVRKVANNSWTLFVGNVPGDATEQDLKDRLNAAMRTEELHMAPGNPVDSCTFHEDKGWFSNNNLKAAFAKFRSVEEAKNGLNLNGLKFQNSNLKIKHKT